MNVLTLYEGDDDTMHVEKLADNKVKIFVSYDDLEKRGIDRDEIWQNGRKVQELFWEMMEFAYSEVGFEIAGPIAIEAFTMPTEGVIIIVTQVPSLPTGQLEEEEDTSEDTQMSLTSLLVVFQDIEEVIRAAHAVGAHTDISGTLYAFNSKYFLVIDDDVLEEDWFESIWSVLLEYGNHSNMSKAILEEYGKQIATDQPFSVILRYFA